MPEPRQDQAAKQAQAIAQLRAGRLDLSDELLAALSDIRREPLQQVQSGIQPMAAEERFVLLERMVQMEEQSNLIDFSPFCLAALSDADASVRALAASGLASNEASDRIEPLLALAQNDPDDSVRSEAIIALAPAALHAEFGQLPSRLRDALVDTLRTVAGDVAEEPLVRANALASVAVVDEPWVRDLIFDMYEDGEPVLRVGAIEAMGRTADIYWLPTLENAMTLIDEEERIAAAGAAGEIEDEDAIPALAELLEDESVEVVVAALEALGEIGGPEAVEQLGRLAT
ncbi:MAG TPA: HEAT repeat domain-containing protein, partial [Dehalococcoidia bacterium]|nr:HEAT repeat domain-containing protein [Dehalococcoidia bacterium]